MVSANKKLKKNQQTLGLAIIAVIAVIAIVGLVIANRMNDEQQRKATQTSKPTLKQQMTDDYSDLQQTMVLEKDQQDDLQRLIGEAAPDQKEDN